MGTLRSLGGEGFDEPFSVDEVAHNLFVGADPGGSVEDVFDTMDLRLVVNLNEESGLDEGKRVLPPEGSLYVRLPMPDSVVLEQTPEIRAAVQLSLAVLRDGGRVLVHCREGYIRSVQFAGMVVEQGTPRDYLDAVGSVARARLGLSPYLGVDWAGRTRERRRVWRTAGLTAAAAAVIALAINTGALRELPPGFRAAPGTETNPSRPAVVNPGTTVTLASGVSAVVPSGGQETNPSAAGPGRVRTGGGSRTRVSGAPRRPSAPAPTHGHKGGRSQSQGKTPKHGHGKASPHAAANRYHRR